MEELTEADLEVIVYWGRNVQLSIGLTGKQLALLLLVEQKLVCIKELKELDLEDCLSCKL